MQVTRPAIARHLREGIRREGEFFALRRKFPACCGTGTESIEEAAPL
jgi:hypothetical protein